MERPAQRAVAELARGALFGNLSYGIYLYHRPLSFLVERFLVGHGIAVRLLEVVLPTAASYVSYRFLERPFLRLKDRYAADRVSGAALALGGGPADWRGEEGEVANVVDAPGDHHDQAPPIDHVALQCTLGAVPTGRCLGHY